MGKLLKKFNNEYILFKKQYKIILFSLFFFIYVISTIARNLAYYRHVQLEPLRDIGFEIFPKIDESFISEIFLGVNIFIFITILLRPLMTDNNNNVYIINMSIRLMNINCILRFLRSISYLSTALPSTSEHCLIGSDTYNPPNRDEIFTRFNSLFDKNCGDMLFSGHYSFELTLCLFAQRYLPKLSTNKLLNHIIIITMWLITIAHGFILIAVRNHYTVDIVVAIYTTILLWYVYENYYPTDIQLPVNMSESSHQDHPTSIV